MVEQSDIMETLGDLLREQHQITLPASGFSMGRSLAQADALVIHEAVDHPLPIGIIAVFQRDERWWAHRVLWHYFRDNTFHYVTKGDALRAPDQPHVAASDIVGYVAACKKGDVRINLCSGTQRILGLLAALLSHAA
ncbi:MAG: hypothetical protein EOM20_04900 [Spartobacteria bacterium]|nr:hypothetical protein [Spartobacteria bacterium]